MNKMSIGNGDIVVLRNTQKPTDDKHSKAMSKMMMNMMKSMSKKKDQPVHVHVKMPAVKMPKMPEPKHLDINNLVKEIGKLVNKKNPASPKVITKIIREKSGNGINFNKLQKLLENQAKMLSRKSKVTIVTHNGEKASPSG